MTTLGDSAALTSPAWDLFTPASIVGTEYVVADSGFPVWRSIRAPSGGGTLVFRTATLWKEQIPGGTFDTGAGNVVTKVFTSLEPLEGVQISAIIKSGSTGVGWEVKP